MKILLICYIKIWCLCENEWKKCNVSIRILSRGTQEDHGYHAKHAWFSFDYFLIKWSNLMACLCGKNGCSECVC